MNVSITRRLAAICALSLTCGTLSAQTGFDFGLRGGIHTSSLLNQQDEDAGAELDYKMKIGFAAGVGAGYTFNNHMGVGIDILYSKQGQGYGGSTSYIAAHGNENVSGLFSGLAFINDINMDNTYTARTIINCIKIPVMYRYTGDNTKKSYFSSFIGPQFNILSGASYMVNDKDAPIPDFSAKDVFTKLTFDVVLGVGANVQLSDNMLLTAHFRLDYGLSDMENKSYTTPGGDKYYPTDRSATHNATGGILIGLNYSMVKQAKKDTKGAPQVKKK